jgi:hypothetical protein
MEVKFKYRSQYPLVVEAGYFYWVDEQEDKIYFAPTNDPQEMVLLSNILGEDQISQLISRLSGAESEVENIKDILEEISEKLQQYLTDSDLDDYVKKEDLQSKVEEILDGYVPDIGDSDLDIIVERVEDTIAEKVKLTWKVI